MREVLLLAVCLAGCAKAQPSGLFDAPDLTEPGTEEDLATEPPPDLSAPADFTGTNADLSLPPDLRVTPPDLSAADLSTPPDLRPPPDLSMPPPDLSMAMDLSLPPDLPAATYPRVNEVAPGVAGVALDEYIELVGGDVDTPLFGWGLWYQPPGGGFGEQIFTFPALAKIPARRYLLIAAAGSAYATSADFTYTHTGSGRLGPAGGAVGLFNALTRIDSLGWGSAVGNYVEGGAAAPAPGDKSCSRMPDGLDTDRNGRDFQVSMPTPRTVNR